MVSHQRVARLDSWLKAGIRGRGGRRKVRTTTPGPPTPRPTPTWCSAGCWAGGSLTTLVFAPRARSSMPFHAAVGAGEARSRGQQWSFNSSQVGSGRGAALPPHRTGRGTRTASGSITSCRGSRAGAFRRRKGPAALENCARVPDESDRVGIEQHGAVRPNETTTGWGSGVTSGRSSRCSVF